jgi:twitching motility protein PilT
MHIHELLLHAVKQKASDLHLSAGEVPMIRLHGDMHRLNAPPLSTDETKRIIYSVMNERQKTMFEQQLELDFSISMKGLARFRVNVFNHTRGMGAVFRLIPFELTPLRELGLPPIVAEFARYRKGLVLVTGPTGSGKSTTLASIIDMINSTRSDHIITIEDPVEFYHRPKRSMINQREIGTHSHSFSNALRSALREDPDVILIGELRDLETISLAMTAAETGHLVFATLHTRSAPDTIDRMIDVFPPSQQDQARAMLSESLRAVVSQVLLRNREGRGRVCAYEVMINNFAVRNLIRENKTFQIASLMQTSSNVGMIGMEQCLKELALKGKITREDAIDVSGNPVLFTTEGERRQARG